MNQAILFNDDLMFDKQSDAWHLTALLSGQHFKIYLHSEKLSQLTAIDSDTKFDLEERVELWLEKNEPETEVIHIHIT